MGSVASGTEWSARSRPSRIAYVAWQVFVRFAALLICYTALASSGALASDGVITQRGSALAQHCERTGPVGLSGLGWYWRCDAAITWDDGSRETFSFKHSELTPHNQTEPAPVAWREVDNRGHMITVETPRPFAGVGWALLIPLLGLAVMGVEIPRLPSPFAEQWAGRRRTLRLQVWQPLALPIGWGLVIAGGLATAAPAVLPAAAVITILLGYVALAVAAGVAGDRRRHGLGQPAELTAEQQERCARGGKRLRLIGSVAAALGVVAGFGNWLGVLGIVAVPLAIVLLGQRLLLVAAEHRRRFDGTAKDTATS